jgi:hypothetical protein
VVIGHEQQAEGIDQEMAFPSGELLGPIIAMRATPFGGPDRLTVDDGRAGRRLAPALTPQSAAQDGMDVFPDALDSPELQPAEHLWPLTTAVLVNRHFATIDDLEEVQLACCAALQQQPALIRSTTRFHWWPRQIHKRRGPPRRAH